MITGLATGQTGNLALFAGRRTVLKAFPFVPFLHETVYTAADAFDNRSPVLLPTQKNDPWLDQLLRQHASPFLLNVLNKPDSFQYQLIYTQINRDKNNNPQFKHYYLNVDRNRYFNPASMVKMPVPLSPPWKN
jgi:hypothetical protein